MHVKKQQLELDMEQQTGSKSGKAAREAVRSAQKFKNQIVKGDLPLI